MKPVIFPSSPRKVLCAGPFSDLNRWCNAGMSIQNRMELDSAY
jgi:hypothetical protein